VPSRDRALAARAAAAHEILRADRGVDGALLLSYVVWPTAAMLGKAPPPPGRLTPELVERIFELAEEGHLAHWQIGERVGRSKSTVSAILRVGRERALSCDALPGDWSNAARGMQPRVFHSPLEKSSAVLLEVGAAGLRQPTAPTQCQAVAQSYQLDVP
jgi:hypothetical protein